MDTNELIARLEADRTKGPAIRRWLRNHPRGGLFGYNLWYWLTHPHKFPGRAIWYVKSEIVRFWQRGRRGWGDQDAWGLDSYILSWLPDAIDYVAENSVGYDPRYCDCPDQWACEKHVEHFDAYASDLHDIAENLRRARPFLVSDDALSDAEFRRTWNRLGRVFYHLWT